MKNAHRSRSIAGMTVLLAVALTVTLGTAGCNALDSGGGASDEAVTGTEPMIAPDADMQRSAVSEEAIQEPYAVGGDAAAVPQADRLIILTAGLRMKVDDVESSVSEIRTRAQEASAVVTDVQISTDTDVPVYRYDAQGTLSDGAALSGWVTVRVPSDAYETFLASMKDLGEVVRQSESESDVTQQHIDLSAQLENLKAQEQRLREFFDQATDVEDLLAIEQELTRVRAQIDSLEAQIAYLERQAAMSTITVELVGPQPVVSPQGESWGFIEAVTTGIRGAVNVVTFGMTFVIATSPLWGLALVVFFVVRFVVRRRRRTAAPTPDAEQQG